MSYAWKRSKARSNIPMERPTMPMSPRIPVSWGECVDKITILEIKSRKATSVEGSANVAVELALLTDVLAQLSPAPSGLEELRSKLQQINETLCAVEDELRLCEKRQVFDDRFVELVRSVYRLNDERVRIKRSINDLTCSPIVEEKIYTPIRGLSVKNECLSAQLVGPQ